MNGNETIRKVVRLTDELVPRFGDRWRAFREACRLSGLKVPQESQSAAPPVTARMKIPQESQSTAPPVTARLEDSPIVKACEALAARRAKKTREPGVPADPLAAAVARLGGR